MPGVMLKSTTSLLIFCPDSTRRFTHVLICCYFVTMHTEFTFAKRALIHMCRRFHLMLRLLLLADLALPPLAVCDWSKVPLEIPRGSSGGARYGQIYVNCTPK